MRRSFLVAAALLVPVSAVGLELKDVRQEIGAAFSRIFPNNKIRLEPRNCDQFYCGFEIGDGISLNAYSLLRNGVASEINSTLFSREVPDGVLVDAYVGTCAALLNMVQPSLSEQENLDIVQRWLKAEDAIELDTVELIAQKLPDQSICTIYFD